MLNGIELVQENPVVAAVVATAAIGLTLYYSCCRSRPAEKSLSERMEGLREGDFYSKHGVKRK